MRCVVEDKRVAAVVANGEAKASGLTVAVITSLRMKLRIILAAPDVSTLSNWKSLRFRQTETEALIDIDEDWTMRVAISSADGELQMNIKQIESRAGVAA